MPSRSRRLAACLALVVGAGALSSIAPVAAAPDDQAFAPLRGFEPSGAKVRVEPKEYAATRVDLGALRGELPQAGGSAVVEIPGPDGRPQSFRVERTQRMESELAAAHSEIATWSGVGVDDPRASIALDITPMGFHAFVRTPGGRSDWYVDPAYNRPGTTAHLSYRSADLPAAEKRRQEGEIKALRDTVDAGPAADQATRRRARRSQRHFYRLALTSDPSYAAYFGTANVLAEKVTLINRVNQIYNDDLATELRLVNDTDKLNLDTDAKAIGADGPCGAAPCFDVEDLGDPATPNDDLPGDLDFCSILTLGQNRTVLGQLIGASNYDVGHIALGNERRRRRLPRRRRRRLQGRRLHRPARAQGRLLRHRLRRARDRPPVRRQPHLQRCRRQLRRQHLRRLGRARLRLLGDGLRRHLRPGRPAAAHRPLLLLPAPSTRWRPSRRGRTPSIEVQTVSLRDFDTDGDTHHSGLRRRDQPITLTRGVDYTNAGVEAAVETLTGRDVSIAQWGYDEVFNSDEDGDPLVEPDRRHRLPGHLQRRAAIVLPGWQRLRRRRPSLTVSSASAGRERLRRRDRAGWAGHEQRHRPAAGPRRSPTTSRRSSTPPAAKTIPIRTPFALTGLGHRRRRRRRWSTCGSRPTVGKGTRLSDNTKAYGPLFRVFGDDAVVSDEDSLKSPAPGINLADGNPTRVFPDMTQVLAGNTNAATGTCPSPRPRCPNTAAARHAARLLLGVPADERLPRRASGPTTGSCSFRLTARDLFPNGGGVAYGRGRADGRPDRRPVPGDLAGHRGHDRGGRLAVPVTWASRATDRLAKNVKISLSTDGGTTFGTVLAASTPNDGSETLAMPNVDAGKVRIKIEAVDNYFFAVNAADFALEGHARPADDHHVRDRRTTSIVLERSQKFTYTSSTYARRPSCARSTRKASPCDAIGLKQRFSAGTHTFTVAAVNAAGVADPTPATVSFTVPRDESTFARQGTWNRTKDKRAMFGDYITSRRRGSDLVTACPRPPSASCSSSAR